MKKPFAILFVLLLCLTMADLLLWFITRNAVRDAAEHALDAALVKGVVDEDATRGELFINQERGANAAIMELKNNLKLDANLENNIMKGTGVRITFSKEGITPKVEVFLKTTVIVNSVKLIGQEGIPVTVKKQQFFVTTYK